MGAGWYYVESMIIESNVWIEDLENLPLNVEKLVREISLEDKCL